MRTRELVLYSFFTALVLLATYVMKIPTPNGYAHLGDALIMAIAVGYNRRAAMVAGALGTALADVLGGYFVWVIFSFVIHGLQGYVTGTIANPQSGNVRRLAAMLAGAVLMFVLYQTAALLLYGKGGFVTSILGNVIQAALGVTGGMLFVPLVKKA